MSVCALTGHRHLPPDFRADVVYDDLEALIKEGYDTFLCGMAWGFDLKALECLIALRQKYRIRLDAYVPFDGQENSFPPEERKKYKELISWCDVVHILYPAYQQGCYLLRDRAMVDRADLVYAYCTRNTGGTAYTVKYARSRGLEVRLFKKP